MEEKMIQGKLKAYATALIDRQVIKCLYCGKIIGFRLLKNAKSRLFRKPLLEWQTIQIGYDGKMWFSVAGRGIGYYGDYTHELGKTVFLTREDAKKRLKELQE